MTDFEKQGISILLVDPDQGMRETMRRTLINQGYGQVSEAKSHLSALDKIRERDFSHIIFDAKQTDMPAHEFLQNALELDETMITVAASADPTIDDVFGLLVIGARGYIVKPISLGSVDEALIMATKGEPISEAILYAKDRNEALASLMMTALDKLATVIRQSRQFDTAQLEVPKAVMRLRRSSDIARTFAKDGDEGLLEALLEFALERSKGPATRLGRLRKRLADKTDKKVPKIKSDEVDSEEVKEELSAEALQESASTEEASANEAVEANGTSG